MWLLLAILACFLWGVVYVLDAHCVGQVFTRPWVEVVVNASFVMAVLPMGALVLHGQEVPTLPAVALALLAGAMFAASQAAYFQALRHTESGVVAAYLNATAVVLPAASYFVFNEVLTARVYGGVTVLVGASVLFCLLDVGSRTVGKRSAWGSRPASVRRRTTC